MRTKKLFLIFHGRYPSEKAASIFAANSCESFAKIGNDVTLLVPRRLGRVKESSSSYYKISGDFNVVFLPVIDLFKVPFVRHIAFTISYITFAISCLIYLFIYAKKEDIIYSNEVLPLLFPAYFFKNSLYEVHDFPEKKHFMYRKLFSRVKWILVTNKWKLKKIIQQFNIPESKIFYEPNAVEIDKFNIPVSREEARKKLNLPNDKKLVVYTGHLYSWKGADTLARAAKILPDNIRVFFVGGTDYDIKKYKKEFGNIRNIQFVGHRPHNEMSLWQKAADVLALPNTAKEDISKYYTSPMKLFEYMASRRPIVASRIPSITEILNDENAVLVEPDNPESVRDGITKVLNDEFIKNISNKAFEDIQKHSWSKRAMRIMEKVN